MATMISGGASKDFRKSIPDSLKIVLLKKGDGVVTNDFGNEGSGGQSYMRFMWKAGNTYGFLLHAEPIAFIIQQLILHTSKMWMLINGI